MDMGGWLMGRKTFPEACLSTHKWGEGSRGPGVHMEALKVTICFPSEGLGWDHDS